MSNNININRPMNDDLPISSPEELHTYVERQKANGFQDLPQNKRAFAHEYIIDYKHRRAATETGIPANKGIRLLREPLVAAYIEYLQTMQLTNNIITKDFINAQYLHLYDMATGLEPQCLVTADGDEYMARKTELGTAHNILDKISKSTEYAKETGNKNAPVSISIDFGNLFGNGNNGGNNDISRIDDMGITIDHD